MAQLERGVSLDTRMLICIALLSVMPRFARGAESPPGPRLLVQEGIAHLQGGRLELALASFEQAADDDGPVSGEAHFFAAFALNRLGRPAPALDHLNAAAARGYRRPEIVFERGWSEVQLGNWLAAIEHLTRFEREQPGRAETQLLLGAAHLGQNQPRAADAAFAEALRRDPSVQQAVDNYRLAFEKTPAAAVVPQPESLHRPWRFLLLLGGGYTTDSRGADGRFQNEERIVLSREPSAVARVIFDVAYDPAAGAGGFMAAYRLLSDTFEQDVDSDMLEQHVWAQYRHDAGGPLSVWVRAGEEFMLVGGAAYRHRVEGRGGLDLAVTESLNLSASAAYQVNDYLLDTAPVSDRDALTTVLAVSAAYTHPGTQLSAAVGAFATFNRADGEGFDFEGRGVFASVTAPLPWEGTLVAQYVYAVEQYESDFSSHDQQYRRRDYIQSVTARASRRIGQHTTLYLGYDLNLDRSNVEFYEYEQHVFHAGLVFDF